MARSSGRCTAKPRRIMSGRNTSGIHASGPAIKNSTKTNNTANRRSVADTTVPDVKNSRTESKSRSWLARTPTDVGRWLILIDRTCSKILAASTTSSFFPVISMIRLRTVRNIKSNTIAMRRPIDRAINEAIAPLGTTRSYTFMMNKGDANARMFTMKAAIATWL